MSLSGSSAASADKRKGVTKVMKAAVGKRRTFLYFPNVLLILSVFITYSLNKDRTLSATAVGLQLKMLN